MFYFIEVFLFWLVPLASGTSLALHLHFERVEIKERERRMHDLIVEGETDLHADQLGAG
jgi:hypothetical protein